MRNRIVDGQVIPVDGDEVYEVLVNNEVPQQVTNFQARAVLLNIPTTEGRTLFHEVDDWVKAQGGIALQAWEYANILSRNSPLIAAASAQFNLSPEQVDQLFIQASMVES